MNAIPSCFQLAVKCFSWGPVIFYRSGGRGRGRGEDFEEGHMIFRGNGGDQSSPTEYKGWD